MILCEFCFLKFLKQIKLKTNKTLKENTAKQKKYSKINSFLF